MNLIKRILCKHEILVFVRNLYGDQIVHSGGYRSMWECEKCGEPVRRHALFPLLDEARDGEKHLILRTAIIFNDSQFNLRRAATLCYFASSLIAAFSAHPLGLAASAVAFLLAGNSYVILRRMRELKILD